MERPIGEGEEIRYDCIDVFFPWNYHERKEGLWDFQREKDVRYVSAISGRCRWSSPDRARIFAPNEMGSASCLFSDED